MTIYSYKELENIWVQSASMFRANSYNNLNNRKAVIHRRLCKSIDLLTSKIAMHQRKNDSFHDGDFYALASSVKDLLIKYNSIAYELKILQAQINNSTVLG